MLLFAQVVQTLIDSDAVKPRRDFRFTLEIPYAVPCFQERILQHIIRIIMVEHDTTDLPVQRLSVLLYDYSEGAALVFRLAEHLHNLVFIVLLCHALLINKRF